MNLRGSVVDRRPSPPVRARVGGTGSAQRILVLSVAGVSTGFIVDGVSEVIGCPLPQFNPAPELSPEQMRLIGRVANLDAQDRMILLVDPTQLLDQIEVDVLAKFDRSDLEQAS